MMVKRVENREDDDEVRVRMNLLYVVFEREAREFQSYPSTTAKKNKHCVTHSLTRMLHSNIKLARSNHRYLTLSNSHL